MWCFIIDRDIWQRCRWIKCRCNDIQFNVEPEERVVRFSTYSLSEKVVNTLLANGSLYIEMSHSSDKSQYKIQTNREFDRTMITHTNKHSVWIHYLEKSHSVHHTEPTKLLFVVNLFFDLFLVFHRKKYIKFYWEIRFEPIESDDPSAAFPEFWHIWQWQYQFVAFANYLQICCSVRKVW